MNDNEFIEAFLALNRNITKATGWRNVRSAVLGDGNGVVIVPEAERTAKGNLYARLITGSSIELVQVANTDASVDYDNELSDGHGVYIGKPPGSDILSIMMPAPFLESEYFGGLLASQYKSSIAMVSTPDRLQFGRIYASGDDMQVRCTTFWYRQTGEFPIIKTRILGDLTSLVPSTSGKSSYIIVGWDKQAVQATFSAGNEFDTVDGILLGTTPAAVPSNMDIVFGFVLLDNGQTTIAEDDVIPTQELFGGGGSSSSQQWIDLTDTPVEYVGKAGKTVIVNTDEDPLIFADVTGITDASLEWIVDSPSRWFRLRHLQYRNVGIDPTFGTAFASTTEPGFSPANAFDNGVSNYWQSLDIAGDHHVGINMSGSHTIYQVAVQVGSVSDMFPDEIVIEKDIGAGYVVVETHSSLTWTNQEIKTWTLGTPTMAANWRIRITGVDTGNVAQIQNVWLRDRLTISRIAQGFQIERDGTIESADFMQMADTGAPPSGNMFCKLHSDASGDVGSVIATAGAYDTSTAILSFEEINYDFSTTPSISGETDYWLVLSGDFAASFTNPIIVGSEAGSPYDFSLKLEFLDEFNNATWVEQNTSNNLALNFRLTIEGFGVSTFNEDRILTDADGDVISDADGNVILGA
jgi:hypothetical protein